MREATVKRQRTDLPSAYSLSAPFVRLARIFVAILALVLSCTNLWQDWYSDPYFAATVQSMRTGWHNFFFLSFDPAGFVSVDKPPLALWLQVACTDMLGFRSLALLVPATLAGLGSIALVYHLTARTFGQLVGVLAALFLTLTPIAVADNRSNNMDSVTLFLTLLCAWCVVRAVETGHLRPLLWGAVVLALGFNAKLLQAYVVLPTFILLYLLVPALPLQRRLRWLAIAATLGFVYHSPG